MCWLTHWGESMANCTSSSKTSPIDSALKAGHSFSLYMGFGGTSFSHWSGCNGGGSSL